MLIPCIKSLRIVLLPLLNMYYTPLFCIAGNKRGVLKGKKLKNSFELSWRTCIIGSFTYFMHFWWFFFRFNCSCFFLGVAEFCFLFVHLERKIDYFIEFYTLTLHFLNCLLTYYNFLNKYWLYYCISVNF